jgi:hypothetical protein
MRLLLIVLLFISCNNFSGEKYLSADGTTTEKLISLQKLDTVKIIPFSVTSKPAIFETAYFAGTQAKMDTFPISFYAVNIGKINIESGKVIAGDPIVIHDAKPYAHEFPVGQFPVQLAIAKIDKDERVAFSRILFSDSAVAKWEFALHEGQKPILIDTGTKYGYGVDAGIGMFIDKKANDAFMELYKKDDSLWTKVFINEMGKHSRPSWDYVLYNFDAHNFAAFHTGYGDGFYATYVGYDSKGNICRLLTDFELVEWWPERQE